MKKCSNKKCPLKGVVQPYENFRKASHLPDGHKTQCKTCESEIDKRAYLKRVEQKNFSKMFIG